MNLSLHDAASRLGIHPTEFALEMANLTEALEDFWPEGDEGMVETIGVMRGQRLGKHPGWRRPADAAAGMARPEASVQHQLSVSEGAGQVIEKLWRKKHWGSHFVSIATLSNHYCQQVENLSEAVEELMSKGFLIQDPKCNSYALNTQCKGEIEAIADHMIKHPHQK